MMIDRLGLDGRAFNDAETRFHNEFSQIVGEISLSDIVMTGKQPAGRSGLSLDALSLVSLTSTAAKPLPSRTPLCSSVHIPSGVKVEYYEQIAQTEPPTLEDQIQAQL